MRKLNNNLVSPISDDSKVRLIRSQRGFSLIELIIVIAIMAILVGIIAPQLIRYIEKTNVSADIQYADMIRTAIAYTFLDEEVQNDPSSQPYIAKLMDDTLPHGTPLNDTNIGSSVLRNRIVATLGYPLDNICSKLKSAHDPAATVCYAKVLSSGSVQITFSFTDKSGSKNITDEFSSDSIFVD